MKRGIISLLIVLCCLTSMRAQNITNAEYFVDTDPGVGSGTPVTVPSPGSVVNFTVSVPTGSYGQGFHFLAVRVKDANGKWGLYDKRGFYVSNSAVNSANITNAEYFFDTDPGVGNGTSVSVGSSSAIVNFTAAIPTSLSAGFHFLAIRVKDANGIWGLFDTRGFYISNSAVAAPNITTAEYFIDTDPGIGNGTALSVGTSGAVVNFTASIPTSVSAGFHFLAIRVKDANGKWGLFEQRGFYVSNAAVNSANITAAEYFFDADPGVGNGASVSVGTPGAVVNFTTLIPTSVSTGFHFLSIRIKDANGYWGLYEKRGFYVSNAAANSGNIIAAEYFIDSDPGIGNGTSLLVGSSGAVVNFTASIPASVSTGFHFLSIRVKDANGYWGLYEKRGFYVSNLASNSPSITAAEYFFDADPGPGNGTALTITTPGAVVTQTFMIMEPGLTLGTHYLGIRVKDANGKWGLYEYDTLTIGNSTINCRANDTVNTSPGECTAIVNNIDPTINPPQSYTYTLTGSTTGSGSGTASGQTFNSGITTVTYTLTGSPSVTCSFTVAINGVAPTITTQPVSQSLCSGTNVTFSVVANGSGLTYQWRKGGVNISGATSSSYTITGITVGDAGNYDVVVTTPCSTSATSNIATLTVNSPPAITVQPSNQTVCPGNNVTFSVTATGSGLTYQWRKGGVNISGATSSSFTINGVAAGDAGNYDVVVSGACSPPVTSNAATLVVNTLPSITAQPTNQTVCVGGNITFNVTATGTGITYQWRKAGVNISGATNNSFSINGVSVNDAGNYDVVVTGVCPPPATSNTVSLTVNTPPTITTQPLSQTACAGTNVTFSVIATGTGLTYQWRKGGVNIGGATNSSFTISGVTASDAANYDVVITGLCSPSVTSNIATLIINAVTTINTQPVSQTVCPGNNVTFSVTATGTSITYQWRKGGSNIVGATSSSYTINGVVAGDAGNYDVVITGACGTVTSNTAALSITPSPAITTQPQSQTVFVGTNVTFNVVATGSGLTYQWRKGGVNIIGATGSSYTMNNIALTDAGNYDVVINGACPPPVTSSIAILTVNTVTITTQPTNKSACVGSNVTFNVVANGANLTYQWQVSSSAGPFTNISGATNSSLTLSAVTITMNGNQYRCVVSGSLNSNAATLTVNPLPTVTLTLPFDTLYQNSPVQTLSGGIPTGGTYTATGISGSLFIPGSLIVGNYMVNYSYTDANGCSASATDVFTIIPKADKVNLYPNPARDGTVNIVVSPDLVGGKAISYNYQGQKVAEWIVGGMQTSYQFKWAAGVYFITFRKGSIRITQRLVITR